MTQKKSECLIIEITEEGPIRSLYGDDKTAELARILEPDNMTVKRASDVEWEEGDMVSGWTVRAHHDRELAIRWRDPPPVSMLRSPYVVSRDGPLAFFKTREEALDIEVQNFWELLPPKGESNGST